jgi:hypothetical protein
MSEQPGSDPFGDFQRWLMKAGARSITRDVTDRVKSTIGGRAAKAPTDVWDAATTEELTDEPPECQWCPICRAARRARDGSVPSAGLSGQFAGAADALAGLTRDAFSLFDAALRQAQRPAPSQGSRPAGHGPADHGPSGQAPADPGHSDAGHSDAGHSDHGAVVVGPGIGWPTVVHAEHDDHEAADERGDREEGGQPGDGGPDGGADQQVEGSAE